MGIWYSVPDLIVNLCKWCNTCSLHCGSDHFLNITKCPNLNISITNTARSVLTSMDFIYDIAVVLFKVNKLTTEMSNQENIAKHVVSSRV
jgi:hypothetical protein